jgi:hypothetical protein
VWLSWFLLLLLKCQHHHCDYIDLSESVVCTGGCNYLIKYCLFYYTRYKQKLLLYESTWKLEVCKVTYTLSKQWGKKFTFKICIRNLIRMFVRVCSHVLLCVIHSQLLASCLTTRHQLRRRPRENVADQPRLVKSRWEIWHLVWFREKM